MGHIDRRLEVLGACLATRRAGACSSSVGQKATVDIYDAAFSMVASCGIHNA